MSPLPGPAGAGPLLTQRGTFHKAQKTQSGRGQPPLAQPKPTLASLGSQLAAKAGLAPKQLQNTQGPSFEN